MRGRDNESHCINARAFSTHRGFHKIRRAPLDTLREHVFGPRAQILWVDALLMLLLWWPKT